MSPREDIYRGMVIHRDDMGELPADPRQWADHVLNVINTHGGGLGQWWGTDPEEVQNVYADTSDAVYGHHPIMMSGTWNTLSGTDDSLTDEEISHGKDLTNFRPLSPGEPVNLHSLKIFHDGQWKELLHDRQDHTASTDGIRYAHIVEADVAEDLMRLAMPMRDAYDWMISDSKRIDDNIPEHGTFYHGSDHEHQPGDILTSVSHRYNEDPEANQERMDYYTKMVGAPNHADWVWMYNHPAPATKYMKNVYEVEPLDEGPWIWNNIYHDDGTVGPLSGDSDFPRLVSPRARVVRKLSPEEHAAAAAHMKAYYDSFRSDNSSVTARTAMPAPLPQGIHFTPFERGDETSRLIQNTYPDVTWEPGPGIAAHLPGHSAPVGHIEWLSDKDADEAEQFGEPKINPGEVAYINVDDGLRRHSIGTELFDQARAHEPRVHHSPDRTELGEKWIGYEQSRHPVMARRIAMPRQDAYDTGTLKRNFGGQPDQAPPFPGPWFHGSPEKLEVGDILHPDASKNYDYEGDRQPRSKWVFMDLDARQARMWAGEAVRQRQMPHDTPTYVYRVEPLDEGPWPWNEYPDMGYASPRARVVERRRSDQMGDWDQQPKFGPRRKRNTPSALMERLRAQQAHRTAMPAPLPKGVFFRYHPELMWSPGVTAHLPGGKQVGSLEWYDDDHVMVDLGSRKPGEIDRIGVHPDYQGNSIATSMFDFAKQYEPRLHHSDQLTDDGRGWSEYEKSRNARLAMAWQDWASKIQGGCKSCTHRDDGNGSHGEYWIEHEPTGDPLPGDALADGSLVSNLSFFHDVGRDGVPELYIAGIHTSSGHRNDGVAEALMRRMHEDHPNTRINPGFMTDDGQAFHDKMLGKEPDARGMVTAGLNGELPENLTFQHHPAGSGEFPDVITPSVSVSHAFPTVSAHDGDKMVGYLQWYDDHPRRKGEIWDLRVHPDYQRRGVGTALFDWTTDQIEPDLHHSNNLSDEGRAFAEAEVARPLADERYEAWRNGQPMPKRFAMAWQDWAPHIQGGCRGCSGGGDSGEYYIHHDNPGKVPGDDWLGRSSLNFYHDTGTDGKPELYISGIHTNSAYQRDGVAESLIRHLHDNHPGMRINPGFMTNDGQAFHDKMLDKEPEARSVLARLANEQWPDPSQENIPADPNYVYHGTHHYNAYDIADSGQLDVYDPDYGTDQDSWPDGSVEPRSYWTHDPQVARNFYPENGRPTLLRSLRSSGNFRQETASGDLYSTSPVSADHLEVYSGPGQWTPLTQHREQRNARLAAIFLIKAGFDPREVTNRISGEFSDWASQNQHRLHPTDPYPPERNWRNIEMFLKDNYPEAHKGFSMGQEQAGTVLDNKGKCGLCRGAGTLPNSNKRCPFCLGTKYKTGPKTVEALGYDPKEIAAGALYLHNNSHPFRMEWSNDLDRLTRIYDNRQRMQRVYDERNGITAGRNGDPPPMTFEPFNTYWSNGIMARHAEDGRPLAHLHWYPDGEIESIRVHPEMQGRDIGKHILAHAVMNPDTYEAPHWGIQPSNHMTEAGRAYARSLGYNPPDDEVTPANNDVNQWGWTAVKDYVPLHIPYTGQNEDEMSNYLEQPWTPPQQRTASADDEGWPVWWRGRHRPAGPFDKRWHPNHPEHIPAPWDN